MLSDAERRLLETLEVDLLADPRFARAVAPANRRLRARAGPVVVGIGAGQPGTDLLAWAATEAAAQGCCVRIVHAAGPPDPVGAFGRAPAGGVPTGDHRTGRAAVDAAVARVRPLAPAIDVTGHVVAGPAARVLLRESRDARLLVVGAPPPPLRPGRLAVLGRSLSSRVAGAAGCPVTVVRAGAGSDPSPGRGVVVGVDGTRAGEEALAFALRYAQRRGTRLTAVHAWCADRPADLEGVAAPPAVGEAGAYTCAEATVGRWRARYPDVPVVVEVVRRDPVSALVRGSAGAALVVVGSHGRRAGATFGSVSRSVLGAAVAPVAVVPPGAGAVHEDRGTGRGAGRPAADPRT